jgi:hypothetical protein
MKHERQKECIKTSKGIVFEIHVHRIKYVRLYARAMQRKSADTATGSSKLFENVRLQNKQWKQYKICAL